MNEEHLPEESKNFGKWNSIRYLEWARRIGPNVHLVISRMFDQGPEQQYYRRVHATLKMADTYWLFNNQGWYILNESLELCHSPHDLMLNLTRANVYCTNAIL